MKFQIILIVRLIGAFIIALHFLLPASAVASYNINISSIPDAGAYVICDPNPVPDDSSSTCTIYANEGYLLKTVEGTCGGILTDNTYTTNPITSNCTIIANVTLVGDVNQDNSVDLFDTILALQVVAGKQPSATISSRADVDGDSVIGLAEAIKLLFLSSDGVLLSGSQKQYVKYAGYPQQFIKTFANEDGVERVNETWAYVTHGVIESFINGQFIEEQELGFSDSSLVNGEFHPQDYRASDTPATISDRHGLPLNVREDQIWNGSLTIYLYSNIYFCFSNGHLKSVFYSIN